MKYGRSALRNMKTILMREHSRTEVDTTLKKAKKISTEKLETYLKFVGSMVLCESEKILQAGEALESLQADFNEIIAQYEAILKDLNVQDTIECYDVAEKVGIVIGMLLYGVIAQITGSMRASIVSIVIFFILGFILLKSE